MGTVSPRRRAVVYLPALASAIVMLALVVQGQEPNPTGDPMAQLEGNQFAILVTSVVTLLSLIVAQVFNLIQENRKERQARVLREWELEDRRQAREAAAQALKDQTAELKEQARLEAELTRARAERVAAELKVEQGRQQQHLAQATKTVVEKVEKSTDAQNHLNDKLKTITDSIRLAHATGGRRAVDRLITEPSTLETLEQIRDGVEKVAENTAPHEATEIE
jgi:hypothetical protein